MAKGGLQMPQSLLHRHAGDFVEQAYSGCFFRAVRAADMA
jgi:hypothetical protein